MSTLSLNEAAAEFIARWEGFRAEAYWDINHWRIGYGSSTEGPDEREVVKGMTTTRERALQNLELRVGEFRALVLRELGPVPLSAHQFAGLTQNQQVALIDLCYNYGHVPIKVDFQDAEKTAILIRNRTFDNNGVNRMRRIAEADLYLKAD